MSKWMELVKSNPQDARQCFANDHYDAIDVYTRVAVWGTIEHNCNEEIKHYINFMKAFGVQVEHQRLPVYRPYMTFGT